MLNLLEPYLNTQGKPYEHESKMAEMATETLDGPCVRAHPRKTEEKNLEDIYPNARQGKARGTEQGHTHSLTTLSSSVRANKTIIQGDKCEDPPH
jgi:hypothetical protein